LTRFAAPSTDSFQVNSLGEIILLSPCNYKNKLDKLKTIKESWVRVFFGRTSRAGEWAPPLSAMKNVDQLSIRKHDTHCMFGLTTLDRIGSDVRNRAYTSGAERATNQVSLSGEANGGHGPRKMVERERSEVAERARSGVCKHTLLSAEQLFRRLRFALECSGDEHIELCRRSNVTIRCDAITSTKENYAIPY